MNSVCTRCGQSDRVNLCRDCRREDIAEKDAEIERLREDEIGRLATVLLEEFGGPTQNESACEMAIRVLREQRTALNEEADDE